MTLETAAPTCANHDDRPAEIRCNECNKPICGECQTKLGEGVYCQACVERAKANVMSAVTSSPNFVGAAIFGAVAAGAGAFLWERVETLFGLQIGIVAILIGIAVGMAVVTGAGGKRGTSLQILSLVLTACGIGLGLVLSLHSAVVTELQKLNIPSADSWALTWELAPKVLSGFNPLGWLIMAFGLIEGYRYPKAPDIDV